MFLVIRVSELSEVIMAKQSSHKPALPLLCCIIILTTLEGKG